MTIVDSLRHHHPDLILVDGGDWGEFGGSLKKSLALFRCMQAMKYEALAMGKRELETALWDSVSRGGAPPNLLVGNLQSAKLASTSPLRVVERKGVKVAFLSAWVENPMNRAGNYELLPTENFLREHIQKAQNADARVVILYGNKAEATALSAIFPEVDVWLLAGGIGMLMPSTTAANGSLIAGPGDRGRELGLVTIEKGKNAKERRASFAQIALGAWVKDSPAAKPFLEMSRHTINTGAMNPAPAQNGVNRFVGNGSCKLCHEEIYTKWAQTLHAKALQTLIAKQEDQNPKCLACHTTGYGQEGGYGKSLEGAELGSVGCEVCHGRAEVHLTTEQSTLAVIIEATCRACHTAETSPKFVFAEFVKHVH